MRDEEGGWKGYLGWGLDAVWLGKDFKGVLSEDFEARLVVVDLAMMLRMEGVGRGEVQGTKGEI